ncbi:LysR family transcriptional regulator [Kosakonia sp.]|uniref:helix-turn-helix domain-containing protein n=1 Tax=Kosakonia sp. TaxID=1916651 RepID=UPI00390C4368
MTTRRRHSQRHSPPATLARFLRNSLSVSPEDVFPFISQGAAMELKWFEDFLSVARNVSFTRAADERYITQSALSRRIRQLEEWLGVPLFCGSSEPTNVAVPPPACD